MLGPTITNALPAPLRKRLHAAVWAYRHLIRSYRTYEAEYVSSLLRPEDICLDVGAHGGAWTVPLSRGVPAGHVYAIEALPYYAEVLQLSMRLLRKNNVTVIDRAIAEHSGTASIVWRTDSGPLTGRSHLLAPFEAASTAALQSVATTTLDELVESLKAPSVRFIKLDIEGAELPALRGATETLEKMRPILFCEIQEEYCLRYGHSASAVFEFLDHYSYEPRIIRSSAESMPMEHYAAADVHDVLFVPRDQSRAV